ncbi:hypothetical protein PXH69_32560 [Rhodococcus qingshengii]|uniref:Uncharacterized protein n=1 Tax=Rhodococcus qingshengii TaxID=334542 RepID=A0AAW6LSN0_RHOSG|nr:hypothetical protein [Rhodococcus qingshengii]MDE8649709.1 hypothetical protein [Rhodococcus qingshengii]
MRFSRYEQQRVDLVPCELENTARRHHSHQRRESDAATADFIPQVQTIRGMGTQAWAAAGIALVVKVGVAMSGRIGLFIAAYRHIRR